MDGLYGLPREAFKASSKSIMQTLGYSELPDLDWLLVVAQSDEIVLATVGTDKVNFSPLTDFKIDFEDRQELKIIEDYVLDLQVILPGMLDSITEVRDQCMSNLTLYDPEDDQRYEVEAILEELNEYIGEVKVHIERAKNLKDKANSTAQLVRQTLQAWKL